MGNSVFLCTFASEGKTFPDSWSKFSSECACIGTLLGILSSELKSRALCAEVSPMIHVDGMRDGELWEALQSRAGAVE